MPLPPFIDGFVEQAFRDVTAAVLLQWAIAKFYTFLLVLFRVSGLFIVGPVFGASLVPANIRVLLAFSIAILITPLLPIQQRLGFEKLDLDGNGRVVAAEVPDSLLNSYEQRLHELQRSDKTGLYATEFPGQPVIPDSLISLTIVCATELALGLLMGLGVMITLSGLQLAGELIDQQTGLSIGQVFNPGFEEMNGSISAQFLYMLGTVVFLCMEPLGAHLQIIRGLVETFQLMQPGMATVQEPLVSLMSDLIQASLILAIQVAAPVFAIMTLVALSMGFLGHTVPQINVLVVGFPIRIVGAFVILTVSLTGISEAIVRALSFTLDSLLVAILG
ncbi:flagellar biosynthetic protein FliR [Calycomorphotria hydatis]|uniref:Flagellar biosynthetic protein FliR n=1 Tax=Calycomorphotria hydatis TaxID=2528027 RepID=A0A517TB85_9PLAN|nr:flagellar biosynthetic protein FliR [Calycomorphotria hydatis]QDT65634.1 Flagellar biosynthetic protein FliR [Calycomorphotria hydatis]